MGCGPVGLGDDVLCLHQYPGVDKALTDRRGADLALALPRVALGL